MDPEIQDQSNSRADCPGHEGREGEREIITRKKMEWDFCSASTISIGRCFLASKWNGVELVFRELKGERERCKFVATCGRLARHLLCLCRLSNVNQH